jgi:hypothetical protein
MGCSNLPSANSLRKVIDMVCPIRFRSSSFLGSLLLIAVAAYADLPIPKQFPIKDSQGNPTLSPPHVYQTNQCATKVYVDSFKPHATINVYLVAVPKPKLIGGPIKSFFGYDAIPLTQALKSGDEVQATQTVNGVTSVLSTPMKVGAMPKTLDNPDVLPPFYACGQIVPVNGLVSGVKLEVQDATTGKVIGTDTIPNLYSSDGWDPPTVSSLQAPSNTSPAHLVNARQLACTGAKSNFGTAKPIDPQPIPCHPPVVEKPIVGNDAVTLDDLYTGAVVQINDGATPDSTTLATASSNSDGLANPVTASSDIRATQTLCKPCGESKPVTPTTEIPPPTLVGPICPGQPAAYVQKSTINATLVLLKGPTVVGYGGAAPGQVPIYLAPPAAFTDGDIIQVGEYIGSSIVMSNTVSVGCDVRMRWQDFISGAAGAKRLASLMAAVKKMKSLDASPPTSADYRRSWAYWANIHGYYGQSSPFGTVAAHIAFLNSSSLGTYDSRYSGIHDQSPPDSIASTIWATCQHSGGTQALNFFGWHRMWLYYFERVVRWAAADDTLRLPYWDYTDPAQVALPAEFQNTASDLYDALRDPGVNTGAPLDANSTNVDALLPDTDYFDYESKIEQNIHGYVHCTVGTTCPVADMGDFHVSANDPIFLTHHGNIDRLWACWQYLHPTPAGAWQDQKFSFVDETGSLQTQPVKNFLDSSALGYVYDNFTNCGRQKGAGLISGLRPQEQAATASTKSTRTVLGSVKAVPILHAQTTVDISVQSSGLQRLLAQPQGAATVDLVLLDVTAQSPPGVLFNVYIARKDDAATRQFVGTLSWFAAFGHHGGPEPMKRTFRFPVSEQLRELEQNKTSPLTISIEATTGLAPADKAKAEAEQAKAARSFIPESKLRIGAIELQMSSGSGGR